LTAEALTQEAISVELVPRSSDSIAADLGVLQSSFPQVRMVNVPDLLRFSLRSWEACKICRESGFRALPHIRAMDFHVEDAPALAERLRAFDLRQALVIGGDAPTDLSRMAHNTTSPEFIRALRRADPELRIYSGFDPYHQGLQAELESVREKLEAGACGLFTQPFFDLKFADLCANLLPPTQVFWGLSPVISASSQSYWKVKNRAFFPSGFQADLSWNQALARDFLSWTQERQESVYFMPIRVDLKAYLEGILPVGR
jgi:methylenetetrahydrofolate reductase (NADPH)